MNSRCWDINMIRWVTIQFYSLMMCFQKCWHSSPQESEEEVWDNQPTLWSWALLWRLPVVQPLKNFAAFLWNLKSHYCFHKSHPLVPISCHTTWVHTTPFSLSKIQIFSTYLHLSPRNDLFPSGFHTNKIYVLLFARIHTTCLDHLILLDLIILIILGEDYKLRSSSLCSFIHSPVPHLSLA
jgi:hypothetical protein